METTNFLKSFFTEHWNYMAVSTACKLHLFDALDQGSKTSEELASFLNLQEKPLLSLLNTLFNIGFLNKKEELFSLSPYSLQLTKNHPNSLKYACLNWSEEHLTSWQNLDYSIKTGKSSFEKIYQLPYFEYLNQHPDKLDSYHKAMNEYARDDYKNLATIIDFGKFDSVMDVGGGYGSLISSIKQKNINTKCYLFDLEKVVVGCSNKDIIKIDGDFFDAIPNLSNVLILSRILHDWNNEKAIQILKNCFKALPENGFLFVIENCTDKIESDLSLLSLNMLVICESFERTTTEYIKLGNQVGFIYKEAIKLNDLQTILIFKK